MVGGKQYYRKLGKMASSGITVDFAGLENIRKEFKLLPHEVGRLITLAVSRAAQVGRTAARQSLRNEYNLSIKNVNRRIRWKKSGRVWIGANTIPADWIPGMVEETEIDTGKQKTDSSGGPPVMTSKKAILVAGQLSPNAFKLPVKGSPTMIRYGKGRKDFHRLEYDILPGAVEARELAAFAMSQALATKFYGEVARSRGISKLQGIDRGNVQRIIKGLPDNATNRIYKPTGTIGERILYPRFRKQDEQAAASNSP